MRRMQYAVKAADEAVNNSATLQNDNDLRFYGQAGKAYAVEILIDVDDTDVDAGIDIALSMPSGATFRGNLASAADALAAWTGAEVTLAEADSVVQINGIVKIGATAGDVRLQWAQTAATVGDTIVKANSYITAFRVSQG